MSDVYGCAENIIYVENIIFGILLHAVAKRENN